LAKKFQEKIDNIAKLMDSKIVYCADHKYLEKLEDDQEPLPKPAKARSIRAKRRDHGKHEKRLPAVCR